jgi:hypothetical protein
MKTDNCDFVAYHFDIRSPEMFERDDPGQANTIEQVSRVC